jgi:transcriptional regulator with XRE-family HTH domain
MDFAQFLEIKFIDWQKEEGGRKTVNEFADFLGVGRSTISMWWTKKNVPKDEVIIRKLADRLGLEVYDVLNMERPDPDLLFILSHWDQASPKLKKTIRDEREKFNKKNEIK